MNGRYHFFGIELPDLRDLFCVETLGEFRILDLIRAIGIDDQEALFGLEAAQVFSLFFLIESYDGAVKPDLTATESRSARFLELDGPDGVLVHLLAQAAAVH